MYTKIPFSVGVREMERSDLEDTVVVLWGLKKKQNKTESNAP